MLMIFIIVGDFFRTRIMHFHAIRWENYAFLRAAMHSAMLFIVGQCVTLSHMHDKVQQGLEE